MWLIRVAEQVRERGRCGDLEAACVRQRGEGNKTRGLCGVVCPLTLKAQCSSNSNSFSLRIDVRPVAPAQKTSASSQTLRSPSSHTSSTPPKHLSSPSTALHASTPTFPPQLLKYASAPSPLPDWIAAAASSTVFLPLSSKNSLFKTQLPRCSPTPTPQNTSVPSSISISGYPLGKILFITPQSSAQSCTLTPD